MSQNFAERLGWIPKSEDLRMSMGRALNFAQERKHTEVTLEHFLLALIDDPNASAVFTASHINLERLRDDVESYINMELQHLAALGEGMAQPSERFKKVMAHASAAAEQSQREVVDGAIVLAALIGEGQSEASHILNNHGMTFDVVVNSLKNTNTVQAQPEPEEPEYEEPVPQERPEPRMQEQPAPEQVRQEQPAPAQHREVHPGPMGGRPQPMPGERPQPAETAEQSMNRPQGYSEGYPEQYPDQSGPVPTGNEVPLSNPPSSKTNIFDQKAYAAPGSVQAQQAGNPMQNQHGHPPSGAEIQAGQHEGSRKQPENSKISGEATVEDILASVREIIGTENSNKEPIEPLGGQLDSEESLANTIKPDDLPNEAFGDLKKVAVSAAEEEQTSALEEVYPSEEVEEDIPDTFSQEFPKPPSSDEIRQAKGGLQDRLKEKSPFQSTEELAKNWPGTGKEKSEPEKAAKQEPMVHENPFQPKNADGAPRPQTPRPPAGQQMPPPPGPNQSQQPGQPRKQSETGPDQKASQQPGQPDNNQGRKGAPPPQGGEGGQHPPHRNMPPPPPGQQQPGNMGGPRGPQQWPHPNQQPPQGKGGPMPVPPPPGAQGQQGQPGPQGQRGGPPPHMAGHPPPNQPPPQQGRRPGPDQRPDQRPDPRMEGRPPVPGQEAQGRQRNMGARGQLLENIPRIMRMGIPVQVEVRMARADVQEIERGMMGGNPPVRHDVIVTEAMSVRLSAPGGGFSISPASPETQWIDNRLGDNNYASWKWTVTPLTTGKKALQLGLSARIMGEKGVIAQSALPEQLVTVKVKINYARTFRKVAGWMIIAAAGGAIGKYSERLVELIPLIPGIGA